MKLMASLGDYQVLDAQIDSAEQGGLRARWEFGRLLLRERIGKKLPRGRLDEVAVAIGKGRQEVGYRMLFASRYPDEGSFAHAMRKCGSWYELRESLKRGVGDPTPEPASLVSGGTVEDLHDLAERVQAGRVRPFGTIYADPPWLYGNQGTRAATSNHYDGMTNTEIANLPVSRLVAANAHLHLWTTNAFLFDAKAIMEAWGFTYKSCFVWVKPQMGIGNYWRVSHEFLLFGLRGKAPFRDRGLMSWLKADRSHHSVKPETVRKLIEKASPGEYLELFSRREADGWWVWGEEVPRSNIGAPAVA